MEQIFFHASQTPGIQTLEPRTSNHGTPLVYFSEKRENVLVYLSNAVEKYCRETGFRHEGIWHKWASYGFTAEGILRLEEYYPNATADTYQGVSGYIYTVKNTPCVQKLAEIPAAYTSQCPVPVESCEYIPDAYKAIMEAAAQGKILLEKYENISEKKQNWIKETLWQEYLDPETPEEYRYFLSRHMPAHE